MNGLAIDDSNPAIALNPEKCIRCGRCVKICQEVQNVRALEFLGRGIKGKIASAAGAPLGEIPCIKCGQCAAHCPVGAIYERDDTVKVWGALHNSELHSVVQIAPAVCVALAEEFGMQPKSGKAARLLGGSIGCDVDIVIATRELARMDRARPCACAQTQIFLCYT